MIGALAFPPVYPSRIGANLGYELAGISNISPATAIIIYPPFLPALSMTSQPSELN